MPKCEACGAELTEADGPGPQCMACHLKATPLEPDTDQESIFTQDEIGLEDDGAATEMFDGQQHGDIALDLPEDDFRLTDFEPTSDKPLTEEELAEDNPPTVEEPLATKPPTLHGGDVDEKALTHGAGAGLTREDDKTPPPPEDSDKAPTVDLDRIQDLWKDAKQDNSSPSATLHVSVSHMEGDSQLTVPARPIAYPETPTGGRADYQIEKFLAAGGMGRVYIAQQTSLGRPVAIKTLKDSYAKQERQRRKFVAEASITARLEHPNIIPIHDIGLRDDGAPFYSMKCVEGSSWDDTIETLSKEENIEILLKVADAVAFAHSRKILHRDLKPDNVMVGEYGEVLVADWGLAIHLERDKSPSLGGTPLYMAPEMASNDGPLISERSDIYLLGAILFEILEGRPPHDVNAKTATERLLAAAMNRMVEHQSKDELIDVALKALEKNPSDRYQTVIEFQQAIRECQRHADSRLRSERAAALLREAREKADDELYSRAFFGYQDAIDLWPENSTAAEGLEEARLAYAEHALAERNFAQGLSLLDPDNEQHRELYNKLLEAQKQEASRGRRLKLFRNAAIGATAATVLALAAGVFFVNQQREVAEGERQKADTQRVRAEENEKKAKGLADNLAVANENLETANDTLASTNIELEDTNKELATTINALETRTEELRIQTVKLDRQRVIAVEAQEEAERSEREAKQKAFVTRIALTTGDLADANTETANDRLLELEGDPFYSAQLDWEAARLRYLCHRDFDKTELPGQLAAVASSADGGRLGFLVESDGQKSLVLGRLDPATQTFVLGKPMNLTTSPMSLAIGPGGEVAVGGATPEGGAQITLIRGGGSQTIVGAGAGSQVTALEFSSDGAELAVAVHQRVSVRVQVLDLNEPNLTLRNPRDNAREYAMSGIGSFSALAFSANGQRLAAVEQVSSSGESRATVWSRAAGAGPGAEFVAKTTLPVNARSITFHPQDDRLLACGAAGGRLALFELSPVGPTSGAASGELVDLPAIAANVVEAHADNINSVAFSPSGQLLATASQSGAALILSQGDGPLDWVVDERPPVRQRTALRGCAWAGSGGGTLVTAGLDGQLRSWPLDRFYNLRRFATTMATTATSVVASGDESLVVVGDANGHAQMFRADAPQADAMDLFVGHGGNSIARVWSLRDDRGASLASLGFEEGVASLCRWPESSRQTISNLNARDLYDLSPNGKLLAVSTPNGIEVRRMIDQSEVGSSDLAAKSLAFLPSGNRLAVGDDLGRITIFQVSEQRLDRLPGEVIVRGRAPKWMATTTSPEGDVVLLGFEGDRRQQSIVHRVLVTADNQITSTPLPPLPAPLLQLACAGDDVAALCGPRGALYVFRSGSREWNQLAESDITSATAAGDGVFIGARRDGSLWRWSDSNQSGERLASADASVEYKRSGRLVNGGVFAVGRRAGRPVLTVWRDGDTRAVPMTYQSRSPIVLAMPTPSSDQLPGVVSVGEDGMYRLWSTESGRPRLVESKSLVTSDGRITRGAVSMDNQTLCLISSNVGGETNAIALTAGGDPRQLALPAGANLSRYATCAIGSEMIAVWDAARAQLFTWPANNPGATATAWRPGDAQPQDAALPVAIASNGRVAVVTGSELERRFLISPPNPSGAGGEVTQKRTGTNISSLAFSPSGDRLLAGVADGRVVIYDVSAGRIAAAQDQPGEFELTTFAEHQRPVTTLSFSPTGRSLLSGSKRGRVLLWPTAPQPNQPRLSAGR